MFLMSNSLVLCDNVSLFNRLKSQRKLISPSVLNSVLLFANGRKRIGLSIPNAKHNNKRKRTWWQKFFFDDDGNWFGLEGDDLLDGSISSGEMDGEEVSEEEKFEAWKKRAESLTELHEEEEDEKNAESHGWEDWVVEGSSGVQNSSSGGDWEKGLKEEEGEDSAVPNELLNGKGVVGAMKEFVTRQDDDDLLYEDRVFRYASSNSAKFLAFLILVPWILDFVVHDYVLMPFLDRYVKTVPLAAEMLDVRRYQKLEMVKTLKVERARFRLEVEIGKSPPLSDEEVWLELRHRALELRDEWRLENRRAFANIFSDMVFGIALFILIFFNQSKVALLKFTGYKLVNNISDTGKAFLIILVTDIFLGYHSESGWQTLIEIILEHYGIEVDEAAVTIFVCFVPVVIDACVKLWLFKLLPRLSPNVANIFRAMQRH